MPVSEFARMAEEQITRHLKKLDAKGDAQTTLLQAEDPGGISGTGASKIFDSLANNPVVRGIAALVTAGGAGAAINSAQNSEVQAAESAYHEFSPSGLSPEQAYQKFVHTARTPGTGTVGTRKEPVGVAELRPTAYSSIMNIDVVTSKPAIGVAMLPDNTEQVVMAEVEPPATLILMGLKPVTDFFAISAAGVRTNSNLTSPDRIVIVGDRARSANQGRIRWTNDGGLNWRTIDTTRGTVFDVKITPDKRYAFIFQNNEGLSVSRLDLATGALVDLPSSLIRGWVSSLRVNPANPSQYISEFADPLQGGYFRAVISPDGVSFQHLNPREGYPYGKLVQFINRSNGKNVIWLRNNDTRDQQNRPVGTIFWNENDQLTYSIQPTRWPGISETAELPIGGHAADVKGDLGFMGVLSVDRNVWGSPWVEKFSLLNPTGPNGRTRIPLPVSGGAFSTMEVVEKNGERFLVVGIKNSPNAPDNGIWAKRITNGISSGWNKVTLLAPHRALPGEEAYTMGPGTKKTPTPEKKQVAKPTSPTVPKATVPKAK